MTLPQPQFCSWTQLSRTQKETCGAQIREVFFQSTARSQYEDEAAKEEFFHRWTQFYFETDPDLILLAWDATGERLLGYLTGCLDSAAAAERLSADIGSYRVFEDLFHLYPAHLHINMSPLARGQGIGSHLLSRFIKICQQHKRSGVHIVTSPGARNTNFYLKNGFTETIRRVWRGYPLLLMGRRLED